MINRLLLRNKVVQTLYSIQTAGNIGNLHLAEKELLYSIKKSNDLYHALLTLIVETTEYASKRIDLAKNKLLPTYEESNPNMKFVNNRFVVQLANNANLDEYSSRFNFSWISVYPDVVREFYSKIEESEFYLDYMSSEDDTYDADKEVWRKIFKKVIPMLEELPEAVEDSNIYWVDDIDVEVSFILKTIKAFAEENGNGQTLLLHASALAKMGDDNAYIEEKEEAQAEDIAYANKLLSLVILNADKYTEMVSAVTKNWDHERLVQLDMIIIKVALAELMNFPTIPVNVTLNEYIELAKIYGTKKSSMFVNGVLDRLVSDLKKENRLQKVGEIK